MAGLYDLMLMIDPTAPEDRRNVAVSEAESMINSGGTLVGSHDWGQRRMAYEIDHRPEADYRLYQFEGDNALLERLNQRLRILDGVLRFRIIKAKPGQPVPPPPDQQALRRRDEREPQDTKVAARAAADAPAADDGAEAAGSDVPGPSEAAGAGEGAPAGDAVPVGDTVAPGEAVRPGEPAAPGADPATPAVPAAPAEPAAADAEPPARGPSDEA